MQPFIGLRIWQRSHHLVLDIYRVSRRFPAEERFGLTAQLRRAAASVPANTAEGSRRRRANDFAHFLNIAESSLGEAEYHLILARDLGYLCPETAKSLLGETGEISRMLYAFRRNVERQSLASHEP